MFTKGDRRPVIVHNTSEHALGVSATGNAAPWGMALLHRDDALLMCSMLVRGDQQRKTAGQQRI